MPRFPLSFAGPAENTAPKVGSRFKNMGPGAMVAAAFIGPGTVTTATLAGASYGYTLLWAVLFSTGATCILQEMAARLGVRTGLGVGEALRKKLTGTTSRLLAITIVGAAIFVGNAAYEAGNISGVTLGMSLLVGEADWLSWLPAGIGVVAGVVLYTGRFPVIERTLMALVAVMGLVFLVSALVARPDLGPILRGLFVPTLPEGAALMVVGLIGTTVVPYNLFLHASSAARKWRGEEDLAAARRDTVGSILLGGLITMAILITAAAAGATGGETELNRSNLGAGLAPLLGKWSAAFTGLGFMAAGLSSAITAPLAASFASTEILGWDKNLKGGRFRAVWLAVLLTGVGFALFPAYKPQSIILFAQVANGLLLPVVAGFLLWVMNDATLLGSRRNTARSNLLGGLIVAITLGLGLRSILSAFGLI